MSDLNAQLIAAHEMGQTKTLVRLYQEAADTAPDHAREAFFLTHAYVFALETDHPDTATLRARLVALGAEPA